MNYLKIVIIALILVMNGLVGKVSLCIEIMSMQKHRILFVLILSLVTQFCLSQKRDSSFHVAGAVTVTNKGISLVPTFTLGKPATIFDLSMGKRKLYFEPQLRFALEGKPWSFLFWWRYRLLSKNKMAVTLGGHPAMNFKTETWA